LEKSEQQKQEAKGKKFTASDAKKVRAKVEANYPPDVLAALQLETSTWQGQGWPQPPGTRWIDYRVPDSLLEQRPLSTLAVSPQAKTVEAVLLAIDGEGKRGTVRPLIKRALPLMELLHSESIRIAVRDLEFGNVSELTGKQEDGSVLHGHRHAHWLP